MFKEKQARCENSDLVFIFALLSICMWIDLFLYYFCIYLKKIIQEKLCCII